MSIASKLTKLETDISNAYDGIEDMGGTVPQNKNTENLETAIRSIPSGGSSEPNIFVQTTTPETFDGIWLQTNNEVDEIIEDDNIYASEEWDIDKMSELRNIPYSFISGEAVIIGTNAYLFGGTSVYERIYKYNILTDTYTQLTNIPYGFKDGSAVAIETDIYFFGGASNRKAAYKYNTLTNTYTQLTNIPYSTYNGSAVAIGTDIYLFGSETIDYYKTAYKYNTLTNSYTQLINIPFNFYKGSAVAIGTDIYLFGGSGSNTTAYKYNTLTTTYTQLTNIPFNFYSGCAVAIGTDIYLFNSTNAYKYNILTDTYTQLNNVPYNVSLGWGIFTGTDIYLFGGNSYPTKVQVMKIITKQYADKSIVIANNKGNRYQTILIDAQITNGLKYWFNNVWYYTTSGGLDKSINRYYGDGTQWVQIL